MESKAHHPDRIVPGEHANYQADKMGKSTIFSSGRVLVGLNAFEPGQEHRLHSHEGLDKVYLVQEGKGQFLLKDKEIEMGKGELLVAPEGVDHGVRNDGPGRLLVLVFLAGSR